MGAENLRKSLLSLACMGELTMQETLTDGVETSQHQVENTHLQAPYEKKVRRSCFHNKQVALGIIAITGT
jgi:hypothetical protein